MAKEVVKEVTKETDKEKAISVAISSIEKQFGKGAIMRLTDSKGMVEAIPCISTGSLGLDIILGIGGVPRGRIVEIYGPESSGKTTLALHIVAEAQKQGGIAAYIDAEHSLDLVYARRLGVKTEDLLLSQPDTGEQALEISDMLIRSNAVDLIVVDSVAALVPRAEIDGEMGEPQVGLQARLMSQAMRKLTGNIHRSKTCMLFINQIRMKIGVMYGNPETTPGGTALKFYSSMRMEIRRVSSLKSGDENIGNRTRVKVVKNKLAPPFRDVEFDILFGTGISKEGEILDLGTDHGLIEKSGPWFAYGSERIGQGRENARLFLADNPDVREEIRQKILERVLAAKQVKKDSKGKDPKDPKKEG
jgi:recombination protein RecA